MAGIAQDPLRAHLTTLPEYAGPSPKVTFFYSSLPGKRLSNPTGYASALSWWRRTLVQLVDKGLLGDDHLVLDVDDDLREKLRWEKVGRPSSLGVVIAELGQTADLVPLSSYLSSPLPLDAAGESSFSVVSLLARPFWWGLSKVWGSGEAKVELGEQADEKEWARRKGEWVVPDLVEKAASALLARLPDLHPSALSRLYTLRTFRDKLGGLCLSGDTKLSERDCRVLATYLQAKGECAFDGEVIKFAAPSSSAPPSSLSITPTDRSILSLQSTLVSLSSYISSLEARIAGEQAQVVKYASGEAKNVALAKSHLVARKRLEKLLEERVGARGKVQEVMLGIERAVGDEETLSALTLGTSVLRAVLSSPTLQLSNISATTSALDDALISAQEVSEAVNCIVPVSGEMDDEVEEELRGLQEEERREKEREREREVERKLGEGKAPVQEVGAKDKEKGEEKEKEKVVDKAEKLLA
ncbi:hypothetical protein JCM10207_007469 [Rhodosporidiobolus poonsookiae]